MRVTMDCIPGCKDRFRVLFSYPPSKFLVQRLFQIAIPESCRAAAAWSTEIRFLPSVRRRSALPTFEFAEAVFLTSASPRSNRVFQLFFFRNQSFTTQWPKNANKNPAICSLGQLFCQTIRADKRRADMQTSLSDFDVLADLQFKQDGLFSTRCILRHCPPNLTRCGLCIQKECCQGTSERIARRRWRAGQTRPGML